jgi:hypothetical protein
MSTVIEFQTLDGYRLFTCYMCGNRWEFGTVSTCKCVKKTPPKMPKLKSGWYKLNIQLDSEDGPDGPPTPEGFDTFW